VTRDPAQAGPRYDATQYLLDRQVVDRDGALVAKVDDLELTLRADGRFTVTAILTGPGALAGRFDGRLATLVGAVWRRLRSDADPRPGRITMDRVSVVDSSVHVAARRADLAVDGLETWVRDHLIGRIPGARHDPG
jgi:hypothetical protein